MRKLTVFAVALAVACLMTVSPAQAEDSGMLEISGNVVSVTGWQRATTGKYLDTTAGSLADGLATPAAAGTEQFGFFVDQVELDLAKSFGENIRVRADLDFSPTTGGPTPAPGRTPVLVATGLTGSGGTGDRLVEQAYTTANIPAGNGVELLFGRFNSGIGLDPVDRNELSTVSFSSAHRLLLPHNLTGARIGYDLTDEFRWEMFFVNSLGDQAANFTSTLPTGGFNAVYSWGDEGNMSWFKFSAAAGADQMVSALVPVVSNKHWSFLGDLAVRYAVNDAFAVGVEGVYRQDNAVAGATDNSQFIAGTLQGTYSFSDVWDGTLRYGYTWDLDQGTGGDGVTSANVNFAPGLPGTLTNGGVRHDLTLATGYAVADGARFGLEGRFDLTKPSVAADGTTGQNISVAGTFAYNF